LIAPRIPSTLQTFFAPLDLLGQLFVHVIIAVTTVTT
jgi:hypothetical protein